MNAISLIRSSWEFFRKQPALLSVGFWLLFLPMLASDGLTAIIEGEMVPEAMVVEGHIAIIVLIVLLGLLNVWGHCCVLVTGKRMLQTKAGRSRTSFRATASQSKAVVMPFLLTNLLRGCISALWMLPFLLAGLAFVLAYDLRYEPALYVPVLMLMTIPAAVYLIRTAFAPVVVIGENIAYRAALKRSKEAMKGNFWNVLGQLLLIMLLLAIMPMAIIGLAAATMPEGTLAASVAESVVNNAWIALATILLNLCLIQMYERYRVPVKR